jgi:hypothetical protein
MSEEKLKKILSARFLVITVPPTSNNAPKSYRVSDFLHLFTKDEFIQHRQVINFSYVELDATTESKSCADLEKDCPLPLNGDPSMIIVGTCSAADVRDLLKFHPQSTEVKSGILIGRFKDITPGQVETFMQDVQNSVPKKSKVFSILGNPSTWITSAFAGIGIAAAFVGLAPAPIAGLTALALMGTVSVIATVVVLPLLIIFPAWLIWNDFKAQKIETMLSRHNGLEHTMDLTSDGTPSDTISGMTLAFLRTYENEKTISNYTFWNYLTGLQKRLMDWGSNHSKQATAIGVGISASIVILLLLVVFPGVGPVAAVTGFLGNVLSTGFAALGSSLPALGGIMAGLAQAIRCHRNDFASINTARRHR